MSAVRLGLGLVLSVALSSTWVKAADVDPAVDQPPVEKKVKWDPAWPRFRPVEAVVTGAMLLPIAGALFLYPNPDDNIHGGFLFDDAVRDALVVDSRSGRDKAATFSNLPYFGLLAFPLLVDTALVTWGIHRANDVALEMLGMDLEAYAITGAVSLTFQKMGRVRPSEKGCAEDPEYSSKCGNPTALNQSFLSGHTSVAFTGAGLTCAHHKNLPLYGGGAPDIAICVLGLAAASTTGVLRIMSDNHYSTDVLLGVGVGLLSGYALPEWLHYRSSTDDGAPRGLLPTFRSGTFAALLAPQLSQSYAGVTFIGGY
jgi:membrane-associated phospholipid phosphatase